MKIVLTFFVITIMYLALYLSTSTDFGDKDHQPFFAFNSKILNQNTNGKNIDVAQLVVTNQPIYYIQDESLSANYNEPNPYPYPEVQDISSKIVTDEQFYQNFYNQ